MATLPPIEATKTSAGVSHVGEPLKIDKANYNIVGATSGKVYGTGTGDTPEAKLASSLALQTQLASGGTPTVAGRPDLYALAPTAAEGTPQAIAGADGKPVMPKVATPEQLAQQRAGTLESFNKATGLPPVAPAAPVAPTAPEAPKPPTDFATASRDALQAGAEAKKQQLLGADDSYDNQILRQKGALMSKLFGQDLTPDDLKWLTPAQSQAIISGDETLIKAQIAGLNTITTGRREMKKEEEDKAYRQYDLLSKAGVAPEGLPPGLLDGLDTAAGLPPGTFKSIYGAEYATTEQAKKDAQMDSEMKMYDFLQGLPVGEKVTIGGVSYSSLNKGQIDVMQEEDGQGNINIIRINRDTGERYPVETIYGVSSNDGWETTEQNGVGLRINARTGETKVLYDLNQPSGGAFTDEAFKAAYAQGSDGGQCGAWVRGVTGYDGPSLTTKDAKRAVVSQYGYRIGADGIPDGGQVPQYGDAFVLDNVGSYGHIGMVLSATKLEDGTYQMKVVDSNWGGDEKVQYRTINSKNIYGIADLGLKGQFVSGTDGVNEDTARATYSSGTTTTAGSASTSIGLPVLDDKAEITLGKTDELASLKSGTGLYDAVKNYQALVDKYGSSLNVDVNLPVVGNVAFSLQPQQKADLQSAYSQIVTTYKTAKKLGTLDAGVEKLVTGLITNIADSSNISQLIQSGTIHSVAQGLIDTQVQEAQANFNNLIAQNPSYASSQQIKTALVPYGLIPVSDNVTGDIGLISQDEFDPSKYTQL